MWFAGTHHLAPLVWFEPCQDNIQSRLVAPSNPDVTLSISDLELIGIHMHWLVLKQTVSQEALCHKSPAIWCNNLPAVSWIYKFQISKSQVASNILLGLATCLHGNQCGLLVVDHISSLFNVLADFTSCEHMTNPAYFLSTLPLNFPHHKTTFGLCFNSTTS